MIIDLQRRIAEAGRIRIGQQVPTKDGRNTRPAKLDTFRLTSADKTKIEEAAQLFGGTPQPWKAPAGPQWEVITNTDVLNVIVPPSDMAFSQAYELWSAGGCLRRCDGVNEQLSDGPCLCDPEARECEIHTRLSVLLRDLNGLGVWRIDTQGYYAAVELSGAVGVIAAAAGAGALLPARLRLEQRSVIRRIDDKPQTFRFAVPVLDVAISPGQLLALDTRPLSLDLALENGGQLPAPLVPVPTAPQWPVGPVQEQAAIVNDPPPPKPRANAAAPLPPTGLAPRTTTEAGGQMGLLDVDPAPPPPATIAEARTLLAEAMADPPQPPPPEEVDLWAELYDTLNTKPEGTVAQVAVMVRNLYRLMEAVGLWHPSKGIDPLHLALKKHANADHLSELRKPELVTFAEASWAAAEVAVMNVMEPE